MVREATIIFDRTHYRQDSAVQERSLISKKGRMKD